MEAYLKAHLDSEPSVPFLLVNGQYFNTYFNTYFARLFMKLKLSHFSTRCAWQYFTKKDVIWEYLTVYKQSYNSSKNPFKTLMY